MDLQADKQVPLSVQFTDEVGNPVAAPSGTAVAYTVDDPTIINLTDNGDGTAVAAAVGPLGTANVHVEVSWNGHTLSGDLQIVVVAGLAERVNIVAGEPTEVTPDDEEPSDAPTNLAASAGTNSASLTWTAAADAASYNVKRSLTAGGPYDVVATGVTATSYSDTGLGSGVAHYYVVSAVKADGTESANSAEVSVTPTA
jgi:hypothetical protein